MVVNPAQVVESNNALVPVQSGLFGLSMDDWLRWKAHYAPNASADEFDKFLEKCRVYGLDPRMNRMYLVGRWDSEKKRMAYTAQIGIGGLISLAQKSKEFRGFTMVEYFDENGERSKNGVWLINKDANGRAKTPYPYACRVGVRRAGYDEPVYGLVYWHELAQHKKDGALNHMWSQMGIHMLEKCAKAKAIRDGFEEQTGGLYLQDEMRLADMEASVVRVVPDFSDDKDMNKELQQYNRPAQRYIPPTEEKHDTKPDPSREQQHTDLRAIPSETELKQRFDVLALKDQQENAVTWNRFLLNCFKEEIKAGTLRKSDILEQELTPDRAALIRDMIEFYEGRIAKAQAEQTPEPVTA